MNGANEMATRPTRHERLADALSEAFVLGAEHERAGSLEQVCAVVDAYRALVTATLALLAPEPPVPAPDSLDALAAALTALGWAADRLDAGGVCVVSRFTEDGTANVTLVTAHDGTADIDQLWRYADTSESVDLTPEVWAALDLVRAYQRSVAADGSGT